MVKMKTKYYTAISMMILFVGLLTGCSSNAEETITGNSCLDSETCDLGSDNTPTEINVDKLEIYHFHETNQCYSCSTVGDYAEETVNTYFKDKLEKGIIVFDHINGELPINKDLVIKYGSTGSSLWLGTYKGDNFNAEENTNVWYKIKDKQGYMKYLKGIIVPKNNIALNGQNGIHGSNGNK